MTCSLFDVPCHIWSFIAPFWTFLFWGFWIVVTLVALGALYKVKQIAGWPGVIGVVTFGLGFYVRDRLARNNPSENVSEDSPDGNDRSHRKPKVRIPPKKGQRVYNPDTGVWELK